MKKLALLISIFLVSNLQSQKKELRQVDKLITQSFFEEANSELNNIESLVLSSEDKNKALFYFYKSRVSNELENFEDAINSYNNLMSINPSEYSSKIEAEIDFLKDQIETSIVNSAVADNQNENYSDASVKLFMAYNLNKDKNKDYLYYAAGSAVNSRDYEKALEVINKSIELIPDKSIMYDHFSVQLVEFLLDLKIKADMEKLGKVELQPKFDGKQMIMIIQPI